MVLSGRAVLPECGGVGSARVRLLADDGRAVARRDCLLADGGRSQSGGLTVLADRRGGFIVGQAVLANRRGAVDPDGLGVLADRCGLVLSGRAERADRRGVVADGLGIVSDCRDVGDTIDNAVASHRTTTDCGREVPVGIGIGADRHRVRSRGRGPVGTARGDAIADELLGVGLIRLQSRTKCQGPPQQQHPIHPTDTLTPTDRQQIHVTLPRDTLETVAVQNVIDSTPPRFTVIESRSVGS